MSTAIRHTIDVEETLALLRAQVAKQGPEFVYKSPDPEYGDCVNWVQDETGAQVPSCIVGHVLFDLHTAGRIDWHNVDAGVGVESANRMCGEPFTPDAEAVLYIAQDAQDDGVPWGKAVESAAQTAADLLAERQEAAGREVPR